MYTFEVQYTKNILEGPLQGSQIRAAYQTESAIEAARASSTLVHGGIFTDSIVCAPWTAHNVRIVNIEEELPSVQIERVAFRALDEDELANLADALEAANA